MMIQTKFHGELEFAPDEIFEFESGIPGFLDENKFILLALDETPFFVLQSVKSKGLAFIMANPFEFYSDYEVDLSQDVLADLQIQSEKEVLVFVILSVKDPFITTTANLQAPIILNQQNQAGKQYIMKQGNYSIQTLLFPPTEQVGK